MSFEVADPPTVSYSSYRAFDECRRKWLYSQKASLLPGPTPWDVLQQKKLSPWEAVAGTVVDFVISGALLRYRNTRRWPDRLAETADAAMTEGLRFSKDFAKATGLKERWPRSQVFKPLDRDYYCVPFTKAEEAAIRDIVRVSVENFVGSDLRQFIENSDVSTWRGPRAPLDDRPSFSVGDARVWAAHDFAFDTPEAFYIVDWKTGKLTASSFDAAMQQLHWYALHAVVTWEVPIERIRLMPVWLYPELVAETMRVRQVDLDVLSERIAARYDLLCRLLTPSANGELDLAQFPVTERMRLCERCTFRGACEGARRKGLQEAEVSNPELVTVGAAAA